MARAQTENRRGRNGLGCGLASRNWLARGPRLKVVAFSGDRDAGLHRPAPRERHRTRCWRWTCGNPPAVAADEDGFGGEKATDPVALTVGIGSMVPPKESYAPNAV